MIYIELDEDIKEELENYGTYDWNGNCIRAGEVQGIVERLLGKIEELTDELEDIKDEIIQSSKENEEDNYYDDCYNDLKLGII